MPITENGRLLREIVSNYYDMMFDLETMGTGPNAAITQIGAVYFNRHTGEIGSRFLVNIDLADSLKYGAQVDGRTIKWWMGQSDEARTCVTDDLAYTEYAALEAFRCFAEPAMKMWSHATFDFNILQNAYARRSLKPLRYKDGLDLRTLCHLTRTGYSHKERTGTHHNALDDCHFQVKYACEAFKFFGDGTQAGLLE